MRMQRSYLAWLAAMGFLFMNQGQANADWLTDYDGHSVTGSTGINPAAADGHFSFAVYENGGNWVDDLLGEMFTGVVDLAGTTVDTAAQYVYFYQVVNSDLVTGPDEHKLDTAEVTVPSSGVTSVGYLSKTVFQAGPGSADAGQNVGAGGVNLGLGDNDTAIDTPGDGAFSEHTGSTVGLVADTAAIGIGSAAVGSGKVEWDFAKQLATGAYSSVFYFTSDLPPTVKQGALYGSKAIGDVASAASAVPAPPAMALALLGAPFMVLTRRRKKAAA